MAEDKESRPASSSEDQSFRVAAPAISLPKGGGAIRGIGEKFAANPVTGTGSMSVPIVTSPGRSGFGPQLSLTYDSGVGNGPFGFGWSLALPSITRKTDKGLPQYLDAVDSDVFILSGAEDLVPEFEKDVAGKWVLKDGRHLVYDKPRTIDGATYNVRRYRPRIEGLFARIERWTNQKTGETHWRSITRDNITTLYGKDNNSRIFDPVDPDPQHPTRIFSWLICESYDDKGNAIVYEYVRENGDNIDCAQANERNRVRTANRYVKRIKYGNRTPNRDATTWQATDPALLPKGDWMFEVVFDYDEGHFTEAAPNAQGRVFAQVQVDPRTGSHWPTRQDPFSSYRAGFEVRTYRLCQRVLMFHHIPDLPNGEKGCDGLVRSTDFTYSYEQNPKDARNPIYSFLLSVTQSGYKRTNGSYLKRGLPPLEFEYTRPVVHDAVEDVDAKNLENLPIGLDGAAYQWTDLHGEGIPGILTEQGGAWFYQRNLSPINLKPGNGATYPEATFAPIELVAIKPNLALADGAQFIDLAGDGQPDLVVLDGSMPGLYEHDNAEGWQAFRSFMSRVNHDMRDPNLRFVDLDGDGHADILITENDALVWHVSLAEEGFGPARRVRQALDEEHGPRLVVADGTQSIYLADLSGDGLTDLVRIRNGEVCYWPNLGYGQFGARVTMDNSPWFDVPDQFDQKRIRLADIDGSGTSDIIYLHRDGVRLYFNQSGNSWSKPLELAVVPRVDDLASIMPVDLLGNGTACLVWSSPLPGDAARPMRYVNLMGGQKPHLLVKTINNLGAETRVDYTPSTKFYLQDKRDGKPWITRLPFPIHVVERVETYDHIGRNRFVTRYAYHHGYFDGEEREFRGFGMVEQWDTEQFAALSNTSGFPTGDNVDAASHVPPVFTRTWFHTGISINRDHISDFFAGIGPGNGKYYREPALRGGDAHDPAAEALLLPDTVLPNGLSLDEQREACRTLKGSMLRQEVYALDGAPQQEHPYSITEQNFSIRRVQPRGQNRHTVFFTHPREAITYHYERNPADPRVQHVLTLEVDPYGNVLREVAIGYGRRRSDATLPLQADQDNQTRALITYTENRVTNDPVTGAIDTADNYRTPLPCETRTYELTGFKPENNAARFSFDEWTRNDFALPASATDIPYEQTADIVSKQKRLIEHARTLYRKDDLTALLPLGELESLALPGESYKLAFTPGLLTQVFQRNGQPLLPNPATVLRGQGADRGGYLNSRILRDQGLFPPDPGDPFWTQSDSDDHWWIPAGRIFLSPDSSHIAAQEYAYARRHFFLPHRYHDPFGQTTTVAFDTYDLLILDIRDPLGNRVTVGERTPDGIIDPGKPGNDYRVLQPCRIMDPNRNRSQVTFDTLGMVVGTAVMGKPEERLGDSLEGFKADLTDAEILDHLTNPLRDPHTILGRATTRLVYDLLAYQRTRNQPNPQPAVVYTLARETHDTDRQPGQQTRVQHSCSYSDGFGREIQRKIQAEPEKINGIAGPPRWVGNGWTIFNNKGKPVRQYEPFFTDTPRFEFGVQVGVSPILFYDPAERIVATLHPNHTYEKVVFDPWRQTTWDVNDTVLGDPRTDTDIKGYTAGYFASPPASSWQSWHAQRQGGALGPQEQAAATRAAAHANTPTTAYFDTLGRPFLTVAHNKVVCPNHDRDGTEDRLHTRVELDIEGNQRAVIDAHNRVVMRYAYDMLGNRIYQLSMEAGARWMLGDVAGKPIRAWDSRGHSFRSEYDPLRRPFRSFATGVDPANPNQELSTERLVYGEQHPEAELRNLRGRLYLHLDQAGAVTNEAHDFKGNLLRASRRIAAEYKQTVNWSAIDAALPANAMASFVPARLEATLAPLLETGAYTSRTTYDALNRPIILRTPDNSVIRPGYNEANLLERLDANLRGATANGQPIWTTFVANIDYDAKGQRMLSDYGNGVRTTYTYDPATFRLTHLLTRRDAVAFPSDCPQPAPAGWPGCQAQNLHYTYDPVGNISHIRDEAQQTIYFRNRRVEPSAEYTYDAIYRLIEASGREHLGQTGSVPIPHSYNDAPRVSLPHPGDGNAMGRYVERYLYDAVGNFLEMQHRSSDTAHGWTRSYGYHESSLIEPARQSNRLSSTQIGNGITSAPERYVYDAHGNMTRMPHLPLIQWDYRDQLRATSQQVVTNGIPETTYYVYDSSGQRIRKITERAVRAPELASGKQPSRMNERIYLGGYEIYREYENDGTTVTLERETLHLMDDRQRIALVETKTADAQSPISNPQSLTRYQFGNHLGSVSLELDENAQIISYEEYSPYGSTTYQAVRSQTETPRRYRYTGKERDEESGLYYHGARYYAPWLGRWVSCDPSGLSDATNTYLYVRCNPLSFTDETGKGSLEYAREVLERSKRLHTVHKKERQAVRKENEAWSKGDQATARAATVEARAARAETRDQEGKFWTLSLATVMAVSAAPMGGAAAADLGFAMYAWAAANPMAAIEIAHHGGAFVLGALDPNPVGSFDIPATPGDELGRAVRQGISKAWDTLDTGIKQGRIRALAADALRTVWGGAARGGTLSRTLPITANKLRQIASTISRIVSREGGLTELANRIKGLGQGRGATVEIALAKTKDGKEIKEILVAGINSGAKGLNDAQRLQLEQWGINIAPEIAKGMEGAPHAEENIAAYLIQIGATGVRWSKAVVGEWRPGGGSYVCGVCREMIKRVGGRIENSP